MKIVIDNLQDQDLVAEIDPAIGKSVMGGDSINSNVGIAAFSNNAESRGNAKVLGFGSNLSGAMAVQAQTGENFSLTNSSSSILSSQEFA